MNIIIKDALFGFTLWSIFLLSTMVPMFTDIYLREIHVVMMFIRLKYTDSSVIEDPINRQRRYEVKKKLSSFYLSNETSCRTTRSVDSFP